MPINNAEFRILIVDDTPQNIDVYGQISEALLPRLGAGLVKARS